MYTLDTNAILYYLKDDPDTVSSLRNIFAQSVPLEDDAESRNSDNGEGEIEVPISTFDN